MVFVPKATSHMRPSARIQYTSSTLIGGKGRAGPSSLHTTLKGPTKYVNCKMDVKSTWIRTWHHMASCFMVTWTIFKNHLLEVDLTQNQGTMALRTLTTID